MNLSPKPPGNIHCWLVFAVFASSPHAYSQSSEEVAAAWRKRAAQTIDACWTGTLVSKLPNPPNAFVTERPSPHSVQDPKTLTDEFAGRCVWDLNKECLRVESNQLSLDRTFRRIAVDTYDGNVRKTYTLQGRTNKLGRRPIVSTWKSPKKFNGVLSNIQCLPLRLVYGGLDRIERRYQVDEPMFSFVHEEELNGRKCLLLRLKPVSILAFGHPGAEKRLLPPPASAVREHYWRPNPGIEENYWLDPQRDYLPVRYERMRKDKGTKEDELRVRVDITYEERGGRYIPESWTTTAFFMNGDPALVVNADVTKLTTNQPVPLEQFRFDGYPQGLYVVDNPAKPGSQLEQESVPEPGCN